MLHTFIKEYVSFVRPPCRANLSLISTPYLFAVTATASRCGPLFDRAFRILQMNPRKNPPPVWYSRPRRLLWMTGAALTLSAVGFAQSTDLPKSDSDDKEQTVELSPFVID